MFRFKQREPLWQFYSTLLRDTSFVAQMKIGLREFININTGLVDKQRVIWDSIKGYIRSNVTLYSSTLRKVCSARLDKLEAQFAALDASLQNNFSESTAAQRKVVRKEINSLL